MSYERADHWTKKAKAAGYAARSVYKLAEIEERCRVLPRGGVALDLGCYPGSWSRYLIERGMRVVGVDFKAPELPGTFLVGSVMDVSAELLLEAAGGPLDALLSDMAPNTSGHRLTDHCRQLELAERAFSLAAPLLKPGGSFVVKIFDGEDAPAYVKKVEAAFKKVRRLKPDATRDRSVEFFLAASGFKGGS